MTRSPQSRLRHQARQTTTVNPPKPQGRDARAIALGAPGC